VLAALATATLATVVLMVAPGLALADVITPDAGPSSNATDIDTLYKVALYIALVVFIGVEARFPRRSAGTRASRSAGRWARR
jgi:hypothetical protein